MKKTIILYGLFLAVAAFGLTWLDYKFWMRGIGFEVYGVAIAIFFSGLGVWIERQRRPLTSAPNAGPNTQAITALGLTKRETQMLSFLKDGQSNKEIARELDISPNTVKTHLANLYEKMGVKNRTEALGKASDLSLIL